MTVEELSARRWAPRARSFSKSCHLLRETVEAFIKTHQPHHLLLVTTTLAGAHYDLSEVARRRNSLFNAIRKRFDHYIWVLEPCPKGRVHHHLVLAVPFDTYRETDLEVWMQRGRRSEKERRRAMNPELRQENRFWQNLRQAFELGRVQVAPVYAPTKLANYLAKTRWLHQEWDYGGDFDNPKAFRFWSCDRASRVGTVKFAWKDGPSFVWRSKVKEVAELFGLQSVDDLKEMFGPEWYKKIGEWDLPLLVVEGCDALVRGSFSYS